MENLTINDIRVLAVPAQPNRDESVDKAKKVPALVLFHGYGACAEDLIPLAGIVAPHCKVYFPDGVLRVPTGPHSTGRAWFPIDMIALNQAMQSGQHRSFAETIPDGFDAALTATDRVLHALFKDHDQIIIGGFSQGAMLAAAHALTYEAQLAGLVLLSGNIVDQNRFKRDATSGSLLTQMNNLKVFQSHGQHDPILSLAGAETLRDAFKALGADVEFVHFLGGHEIPGDVCLKLAKFMQRVA